ncbi:hypothetical protein [Comamonas endophytica]|uniref:Uncharacterized protein n=1 Tax=Comamonas endophytica TaxID=2949090 RepID=A0ABY6GHG2_9BURK|nr:MULTISPECIES: hypothetical protein [unclassified Acidovorax]MCD2513421.1 hypothetical protein [Acidovorax sp. D4N7]UYG53797.1 hypothetical protein M9799_17840 [Acidovorax sp. 5MLIR]
MDWLTFTAEIFKAAAWPLAAVAIALMFRAQLRALLTRMNKGRFGPAEFEFEQTLQTLVAQSAAAGTLHSPATAASAMRTSVPPREAIAVAWHALEHAAQVRAQTVPRLPPLQAQDMALYQQLEALHEQAIGQSQFHPSAQAVNNYARLARGLQARMKGVPPG